MQKTATDRVIPHNIDAEAAVLGAVLLNPRETGVLVCDKLTESSFYSTAHRVIFREVSEMVKQFKTVDLVTLTNRLQAAKQLENVGGAAYMADLLGRCPTTANLEAYMGILREKETRRQMISTAAEVMNEAYEVEGERGAMAVAGAAGNAFTSIAAGNSKEQANMLRPLSDSVEAYRKFVTRDTSRMIDLGRWLPSLHRDCGMLAPGEMVLVIADTGVGKCLGRGTMVMRANGQNVPVETLRDGDLLMGPDSKPRRIISVTRGHDELYRVTQKNGDDFICNSEHLLAVQTTSAPRRGLVGGVCEIIRAKDWVAKSASYRHTRKGYKVGVEFPAISLPVDPYFLGLWLGDGNRDCPSVTTGDPEIVRYLKSFARHWGLGVREDAGHGCKTYHLARLVQNQAAWCRHDGCAKRSETRGMCKSHYMAARYRREFSCADGRNDNPLRVALAGLGVLNNKHIPADYKFNSTANRLKLLAGLIDSDGHKCRAACYEFTNTSKQLAEDVCWLARSLGLRASLNLKKTSIKSIGFKGIAYRVIISGALSKVPVKLPRKKAGDKTVYAANRYGIEVTPIGRGEYFGFTLDHPDGLFLLGDFTVTHNTCLAQNMTLALSPTKTALFELELPEELTYPRYLQIVHGKDLKAVYHAHKSGEANDWHQDQRLQNVLLCSESGLCVEEIERRVMVHNALHSESDRIGMVVVDYFQLLRGKGANRYERFSNEAEACKVAAKRTKSVWVVISQISRPDGEDPAPSLHDAKETGSLENSSGLVLGVWRDPNKAGRMFVKILKRTTGRSGLVVPCDFDGPTMRITEFVDESDLPGIRKGVKGGK